MLDSNQGTGPCVRGCLGASQPSFVGSGRAVDSWRMECCTPHRAVDPWRAIGVDAIEALQLNPIHLMPCPPPSLADSSLSPAAACEDPSCGSCWVGQSPTVGQSPPTQRGSPGWGSPRSLLGQGPKLRGQPISTAVGRAAAGSRHARLGTYLAVPLRHRCSQPISDPRLARQALPCLRGSRGAADIRLSTSRLDSLLRWSAFWSRYHRATDQNLVTLPPAFWSRYHRHSGHATTGILVTLPPAFWSRYHRHSGHATTGILITLPRMGLTAESRRKHADAQA
jgi:hypothetical protein